MSEVFVVIIVAAITSIVIAPVWWHVFSYLTLPQSPCDHLRAESDEFEDAVAVDTKPPKTPTETAVALAHQIRNHQRAIDDATLCLSRLSELHEDDIDWDRVTDAFIDGEGR